MRCAAILLAFMVASATGLEAQLASTQASPAQPAAAQAAPDPQAEDRANCASMIAQQNRIEMGGFSPDQLMSMAHGTSALDLSLLAAKSSDRNQHYEACVTYALAAASYKAEGGKDARSNTSTSMQMAVIEQKLGDGKKLGFLDKTLKMTSRMDRSLASSRPAGGGAVPQQPAQGGGLQQPASQAGAPAAGGAAPPCDRPPCGML